MTSHSRIDDNLATHRRQAAHDSVATRIGDGVGVDDRSCRRGVRPRTRSRRASRWREPGHLGHLPQALQQAVGQENRTPLNVRRPRTIRHAGCASLVAGADRGAGSIDEKTPAVGFGEVVGETLPYGLVKGIEPAIAGRGRVPVGHSVMEADDLHDRQNRSRTRSRDAVELLDRR